ncbi:hypothetical protein ACWF94_27445 [Streptomyces sp. NPDC055078]
MTAPTELADLLVAEGVAIRPGTRSSAAEIALVGVTAVTTTISILQGPDTFIRLTGILREKYGNPTGVKVRITARGESVNIEVSDDTDIDAVARQLQEALVGDDE